MPRRVVIFLILFATTALLSSTSPNWGFFGHRLINKMAVFTLPPEMLVFYKSEMDYLTEHAIDPDKRRYRSEHEGVRHYLNADDLDVYPFLEFPRTWTEALAKFTDIYLVTEKSDTFLLLGKSVTRFAAKTVTLQSPDLLQFLGVDSLVIPKKSYLHFIQKNILNQYYESDWTIATDSLKAFFGTQNATLRPFQTAFAKDRLTQYGILPWHLQAMLYQLTWAFEANDAEKILRLSADFGHYIGDAHVPLHTTKNYNGQLTDQRGIHGFWESRLPELFSDEYDFFIGKADYIERPTDYFWNVVLESNRLVDSVLQIERTLRQGLAEDQIYCYEERGAMMVRTYCPAFAEAYHRRMQGMVEARMRAAIKTVGDAWYTAWVNAGQPDLTKLTKDYQPSAVDLKEATEVEKAFKEGKIKGIPHEN